MSLELDELDDIDALLGDLNVESAEKPAAIDDDLGDIDLGTDEAPFANPVEAPTAEAKPEKAARKPTAKTTAEAEPEIVVSEPVARTAPLPVEATSKDEIGTDELDALAALEVKSERLSVGVKGIPAGFIAQMHKDLAINRANVDRAFFEQAGLFGFYAEQAAKAAKLELDSKLLVEAKEAMLYEAIRNRLNSEGVKSTEKMIDQELSRHPELLKVKQQYNEVKTSATLLRDNLEALKQKKDMLYLIGTNERVEKRGALRVVESAREKVDSYLAASA